ncbi:DUF3103 family protein [Saccharospirillum salsuginis]|uniref:DUF3103 domain-containing protein n=1 Tax=Saccharospirillum salsuginis TaxID=418750 RepID=A0A918K8W4_9GAMM|nr:DUF3103 family protein [Saccharospirillum salsuginis]GGX52874.1 hypothetical protein GCM10007392_20390 [Saccharospirillum salsuginis]
MTIKGIVRSTLLGAALAGQALSLSPMVQADARISLPGGDSRVNVDYKPVNLHANKRQLALRFAQQYDQFKPLLEQRLDGQNNAVQMSELSSYAARNGLDIQAMKSLDRAVRQSKGMVAEADHLIEVRMADDRMIREWQQGAEPLFAYVPEGDEESWYHIEAFDADGRPHSLSPDVMPDRPVFVVGINAEKDLRIGLEIMQQTFEQEGVSGSPRPTLNSTADSDLETTVLKRVSVQDDNEPWIKGAAEVYSIVSGVDYEQDDARINVVDMPYLDYDGTDYYPNQVMVYWDRYRFQAVDMVFMEHDDSTNYKDLSLALVAAAQKALELYGRPDLAAIGVITTAILQAIPDDWMTDDDDYMDVIYTLMKYQTLNGQYGVSGNVRVDMEPLVIPRN